jgi:hypothetical protein
MNKKYIILIIIIVSLGAFIAIKIYLNRDKDPMTYFNHLKSIRIELFKGWRIIPRDGDEDFINFGYIASQFDGDTINKEPYFHFGYDKIAKKIKFFRENSPSGDHSLKLYARLTNMDTLSARKSIELLINEYLKSEAYSIVGVDSPMNFIRFHFGKNGNVGLLYIPDEANNEQRIEILSGNTLINKNWSYYLIDEIKDSIK